MEPGGEVPLPAQAGSLDTPPQTPLHPFTPPYTPLPDPGYGHRLVPTPAGTSPAAASLAAAPSPPRSPGLPLRSGRAGNHPGVTHHRQRSPLPRPPAPVPPRQSRAVPCRALRRRPAAPLAGGKGPDRGRPVLFPSSPPAPPQPPPWRRERGGGSPLRGVRSRGVSPADGRWGRRGGRVRGALVAGGESGGFWEWAWKREVGGGGKGVTLPFYGVSAI